jgi:NitT/TauT family transport system permease protein
MPWAIASQTIPILAIAPMIIVVLNAIGDGGADPEISDLGLSEQFFPVVVGMVKGPAQPRRDAARPLRTYSASGAADVLEAAPAGLAAVSSSPR